MSLEVVGLLRVRELGVGDLGNDGRCVDHLLRVVDHRPDLLRLRLVVDARLSRAAARRGLRCRLAAGLRRLEG